MAEDDIGLFNLFWNKTTLFKERVALKIGLNTLTIQVQDAWIVFLYPLLTKDIKYIDNSQ